MSDGDWTITFNELPRQADRPLAERVADLTASCEEHIVDGDERWAQLVCDGCGLVVRLDAEHPKLPAGWIVRDAGDYCPQCASP